MTVPSFCKIVFAVVFLFLGYIPVNVTFWIERWSESGDEVNTLHSVCFDRENDRCCQTFEDRHEQTPEWISHLSNSMITAYVFATLTSILLVVICIRDYRFVDIITAVFSFGTALCLAISVGIFDKNYKDVSAFNQHRHGPSFFLSFVCIFIYLILSLLLVLTKCLDVQVSNKVNPNEDLPSSPRPATIPKNDAPIVKADQLVYRERAGNKLILSCTIKSSPLKKVIWRMKADCTERILDLGNNRYNQEYPTSHRLTIQNLKPSDAGRYMCLATNENRTGASEYISVIVLYPPTIHCIHTEYIGELNSDLTIDCYMKAFPIPTVQWKKRENNTWTNINWSNEKFRVISSDISGSLTINAIESSDAGKYMCTASNQIGAQSSEEINVTVHHVPKVVANRTEYYSIVGRDIHIETHIHASPAPISVRWVKIVNNERHEINRSNCLYDIRNPSLRMKRPTANQTGIYQCIVENTIGIGKSKPISVQISYEPIVTCSTTSFTKHQGEDLELIVSVKSLAPITLVYWEKNANNEVTDTETPVSESPCLKIQDLKVSDIGIYQCFVQNDAGVGYSPEINVNVIQRHGQNSNPDGTLCRVCMDRPKEVVFLPCSHRACCEECGYYIYNNGAGSCPICMCEIGNILRTYDP